MDADEPTDADFTGLLDEARGSAAAAARTTRRWLRQQSREEARLAGVLVSAAESHSTVMLRTTSGRSHTGAVRLVGDDFCVLQAAGGDRLFVRMPAITVVQPDPAVAAPPAADGRSGPVATRFVEALADQAGERADVSFACAGQQDPVRGRLLAVGVDVATVELEGRRGVAYVALESVTEAWVRASG